MDPARLFLWTNVYPGALLAGGLVAWGVYWLAHPRPTKQCGGVVAEAWRMYAFAAAVPGFLLGAELYLWLLKFDYCAPLLLTGLVPALGLTFLALGPTPLIVAGCDSDPRSPAAWRRAAALVAAGMILTFGVPELRARSWSSIAHGAESDSAALHEVVLLTGYGYADIDEASAVYDRALLEANDVLALVDDGQAGRLFLEHRTRAYSATRLEQFLSGPVSGSPGLDAVDAIWWLTDDRDRTVAAYSAATGVPVANAAAAATHALQAGHDEAAYALLEVLEGEVGRRPFPADLIAALGREIDRHDQLGDLAVTLLFRDGSRAALRQVLPLFADGDDATWQLLIAHCPRRTFELRALTTDSDPRVAQGANAVLAFVRQYCVSSAPVTG